jgi:hypothetical protein
MLGERNRAVEPRRKAETEPPLVSENAGGDLPTFKSADHDPAPGKMTRIELQTADPNIRIIWLAPKETETKQKRSMTD